MKRALNGPDNSEREPSDLTKKMLGGRWLTREEVDAEVKWLLHHRLAAVYDWASDPEFDPGDKCFYGDAQMHVLALLTQQDEIDATDWVNGDYVRETDPA